MKFTLCLPTIVENERWKPTCSRGYSLSLSRTPSNKIDDKDSALGPQGKTTKAVHDLKNIAQQPQSSSIFTFCHCRHTYTKYLWNLP